MVDGLLKKGVRGGTNGKLMRKGIQSGMATVSMHLTDTPAWRGCDACDVSAGTAFQRALRVCGVALVRRIRGWRIALVRRSSV